jgi:ribonuclease P protein component
MKYTLNKHERLKGRSLIESLFTSGSSFFLYPFKIIYIKEKKDDLFPAKFTISVSKKRFKRAVKRNRIKRIVKEAYRFNKPELCKFLNESNLSIICMFIYVGKDIPKFETTKKFVLDCINELKINLLKDNY